MSYLKKHDFFVTLNMFRFDRNSHKAYNFKQIQKESDHYKEMSEEERTKVFIYLQSVAYDYPLNSPPKMDKSVHSCR